MATTAAGAAHLSPADLAAREGVPLATVYTWNYTGTGPRYFRAGRHVRYRLADVERWEREREATRDARTA
jgi:predicted DNA-binding transcriptional regulator AlpA